MAITNTQILKSSNGRFVSVVVNNSKRSGTFVGKVVSVTPSYITLNTFRNVGFNETSRRVRKFAKSSIVAVSR